MSPPLELLEELELLDELDALVLEDDEELAEELEEELEEDVDPPLPPVTVVSSTTTFPPQAARVAATKPDEKAKKRMPDEYHGSPAAVARDRGPWVVR